MQTKTFFVTYRPKGWSEPLNQEQVEISDNGTAKDAKEIIENKYGDVVAIHVSAKPNESIQSRFIDWRK